MNPAKLDLPEGFYLDFGDADVLVLRAPDNSTVGRYMPSVRGEVLIREAREHRAVMHPCTDWDCPVCKERGLIA